MDQIKGKNVMVTGGAGGLGYKYAEFLLRNGAKCVALLDLATSPGVTSAETLEQEFGKGKAIFYPCDVTKENQIRESFTKVINKFGVIDILINNAGMLNEACLDMTIDLNVTSLIRSTFIAMDYMGKHKGGRGGTIVNIASILGLTTMSALPIYTATKHAVVGFSRSIMDLYNKTGIRVLILCPGITATPMAHEIESKVCNLINKDEIAELTKAFPTQTTDVVAQAMVELIQKGKNGAAWVSEAGEPPYSVRFDHYQKRATHL